MLAFDKKLCYIVCTGLPITVSRRPKIGGGTGGQIMPHDYAESLQRLAISESGFIFDPASGQSFTVNETGLNLIRLLQKSSDVQAIIAQLQQEYDIDGSEMGRDIEDFQDELGELLGLK